MKICSLCGKQNNLQIYYVSCGSETKWICHEQGNTSDVSTKDDIVIWNIGLCYACIVKEYTQHILKSIKDASDGLYVMAGGIVAGIAAYLWIHMVETGNFTLGPGSSKTIWAIFMTASLMFGFIGLLGLPLYLNRLLSYRRKQMAFKTEGKIDIGETGGVFENAAKRILDTILNNTPPGTMNVDITENYELPLLFEKPNTVKGHEKATFTKSSQQRTIVGSGKTPEEAAAYAGGWIDIFLKKRKGKGGKAPEEVHSKWPREFIGDFNKFLYLSVINMGFLVASIAVKRMGYDDISFLMRIPVSAVITLVSLSFWFIALSDYMYDGKLFGPRTVASWRPRFWLISFTCLILIATGFVVGFTIHF